MSADPIQKIRDFLDGCASSAELDAAYASLAELEARQAVQPDTVLPPRKTPTVRETMDGQAPVLEVLASIERLERERDGARAEASRLRAELQRRDEQILRLSTALLPTTEPAERLVAELMAASAPNDTHTNCGCPHGFPCGLRKLEPISTAQGQPANPHPSGCHTSAPGSRDCDSDGHESCCSCSRRTERDELVWREGGIVVPPRRKSP